LSFQVSVDEAAKQQAVTLTAALDGISVEDTIMVGSSSTPVLSVPGDQFARFGKALRFQISAVDPWGLPVDLTAAGVPKGAAFDPQTGWFEWVPDASDTGKRRIDFTATNVDRKTSTAHVTIDVDSGAPVLNVEGNLTCSPGAIGTLNGKWLAEGIHSEPSGQTAELGGARVKVNGESSPLIFASPTRVSFLCPALDPGAQLSVAVETAVGASEPVNAAMRMASPEIFSMNGSGGTQGMVSFADSTDVVSPRSFRLSGHPAQPGDAIQLWGTGFGSAKEVPAGSVRVKLGGELVEVESVRAVASTPGVYAVQVRVPRTITFGDSVPVQLQVTVPDGKQFDSNVVTMAVEPVN
jgi:uncharacterized protein (TIGR03437 family)